MHLSSAYGQNRNNIGRYQVAEGGRSSSSFGYGGVRPLRSFFPLLSWERSEFVKCIWLTVLSVVRARANTMSALSHPTAPSPLTIWRIDERQRKRVHLPDGVRDRGLSLVVRKQVDFGIWESRASLAFLESPY